MVSARETWLIQLRAQRAAARAITMFAAEGIDALPVKGVVTSRTLYPDVAERILTDVDLKIRPSDFRRALRLVRREGHPLLQLLRSYGNFVFAIDGVPIDVETTASAPGLCALRVDTMIARATPSDLFGVPHLLPDLHDHAVVLLLNVFKDKLVHAFRWAVRDVALLAERVDEATLVARLDEASALTMAWIVARWMSARGDARWGVLADAIGDRVPRPAYAREHEALLHGVAHDAMRLRLHSRSGADSARLRATALVRAGAVSIEMALSRFGSTPYRRTNVPDDVLPE